MTDRWLCSIGSHDHSLISPRWSQEPRVSLSSARAGWIRIPFSLTSLQRLTCVTFLSWQHSAGVTLCDAWLAVITPLGSYIRHKVTKKVLSINKISSLSLAPHWNMFSCLLSEMNSLYRNIDFVTRPSVPRHQIFGLQILEGGWYHRIIIIIKMSPDWCLMMTIIQTSWSLTPGSGDNDHIPEYHHSHCDHEQECDLFIVMWYYL